MKKLMLVLALVAAVAVGAQAKDTYARDASVLPAAARTTLTKNFKAGVSLVKIDKTLSHVNDYEVILTDGTEVEFDAKGNWKSVEVGAKGTVPAGFVPQAIRTYVGKDQPKARIVGIERERKGYSVDLSNGIEMKFDQAGKFLRYDD